MDALDGINLRYGRGTVMMTSAGLAGDKRTWSMRGRAAHTAPQHDGTKCR